MKFVTLLTGMLIVAGCISSPNTSVAAGKDEAAKRTPAMGPPESQCVFSGTKAQEWFNKIQKLTPNCGYMSSDTNGLKICDDDMASIMCKKFHSHYKCIATTLALTDPVEDCKGSALPTL